MSDINRTIENIEEELRQTKMQLEEVISECGDLRGQIRTGINFKQLVEHSLNFIQLLDNNGIIKYVNYVLPELKYEEVIGTSVFEFLDPEYEEKFREKMKLAFSGETAQLETINTFGKYFLNHFIPYYENNDEIILVAIDITEQKTAELALKESENKYRSLVQNIPGMIYQARPDWSAEIFSNCELISGFTNEEINLKDEKWLSLIHPDDKSQIYLDSAKLSEKPGSLLQRYRIVDKQGEIRWVEDRKSSIFENGEFNRIYGSVFDITEKKKQEEELMASEELHRIILTSMSDAVFVTNEVGAFTYICSNVEIIFGLSEQETEKLGNIRNLIGDVYYYQNVLKRDEEITNVEIEIQDKQGIPHSLLMNIKKVSIISGTLLFTFRDITERKKQEEKFRESEKRYRILFETSPLGIVISRKEFILFANKKYVNMFKYEEEHEVENQPVSSFQAPELVEELAERGLNRERGRDEPTSYDTIGLKKDGTKFPLHVEVDQIKLEDGPAIITFIQDITERKQSEEALKESEKKYRGLIENSPNYIQILDRNGTVKYINNVQPELKIEEFIGSNIISYYDHHNGENIRRSIERAFSSNESVKEEITSLLGYTYLAQYVALNNLEIMVIAVDITETKRIGKELEDSEKKFRDFVELSQDLIWKCDAEGKYTYLNPAWEEVLGFTLDEMLGQPFSKFLIPEIVEKSIAEFSSHLAGGIVKGFPSTYIAKNGEYIHFLFNAIPLMNEEGEIIGTQGTAYDITERLKSEEKIKLNQYYLEKAQEMGKIGSWELDLRKNILYWTKENYHLFGVPIGTPLDYEIFISCVHPEDREYVDNEWMKAVGGKPYDIEHRLLLSDGSVKWVRQKAELEYDHEGKGVVAIGFTQDITNWKEAEKELEESENKYRNLVETSQDLIWSCDVEGRFIYLNPAWEDILGYKLDEMMGEKFTDFKKPNLVEKDLETSGKILSGGSTKGYNTIYMSKTGEEVNLVFNAIPIKNENGEIIGTQGTAYDTSDLIRTEKSLRESEEIYHGLFENLPIAVRKVDFSPVIKYLKSINIGQKDISSTYFSKHLDMAKECVKRIKTVDANQAEYDFHGASKKEDLDNLSNVFTEKSYQDFATIIIDLVHGKTPLEVESEMITLGGTRRDVLLRLTIQPGYEKSLANVLISSLDITERKMLEEEIFKTSKLESVGILAGGIAHDFNNLLSGITGNISLARLSIDDKNKQEKYLMGAEKASLRAKNLTDQLLTFAKGGVPTLEMVSVEQIIKESSQFVLRGSNVKSEIAYDDNLWVVEIDPGQIGQVIQNMVINSAQSMPEGGIIKIHVKNIVEDNLIPKSTCKNFVNIEISDKGIGIKEKNLNKIFDPFFTTKQTGSGLGLATSHSIIQQHHGKITVKSVVGEGTTMSIYLPATGQFILDQVEIPKKENVLLNQSGQILVMDDEVAVQNVLEEMLSIFGFDVILVNDGEEAVSKYQEILDRNGKLEFVILDLTISGGMGGKETIKHLLAMDPQIKAIVASGYSNDPVLANYEEYGFCGRLTKPFTFEELEEILGEILN